MILQIDQLEVRYGSTHALRGVSVTLSAGEITAILGPNGAGKTTLLRTIAGVVHPSAGTIQFAGRSIAGQSALSNVRSGIVLCPEGRELFEGLTVEENLRMGAVRTGMRWHQLRSDCDLVIQLFPIIGERWRQRAGTLSGGEQQMVAIARSLLARPKVLLLDEPALGLAPAARRQVFSVLPQLAQGGMPILLVEQNATAALGVAHRVYVLRHGRVVSEGPASDTERHLRALEGYLGTASADERDL